LDQVFNANQLYDYYTELTYGISWTSGAHIITAYSLSDDGKFVETSEVYNRSEFWDDQDQEKYEDYNITNNSTSLSAGVYAIWSMSDSSGSIGTSPVPEPTTMLLFGTGIAGFAAFGRIKRD